MSLELFEFLMDIGFSEADLIECIRKAESDKLQVVINEETSY